jgi:ribonuclease G
MIKPRILMKKEIIINAALDEVRIAITEDGKLAELFIEMPDKERAVGSVYLGKVTKVIQGINAAFVNIGLNQDAFLHFSDVEKTYDNLIIEEDNEPVKKVRRTKKAKPGEVEPPKPPPKKTKSLKLSDKITTFSTKRLGDVEIKLEAGQKVIVQIVREAYANKGVRISTRIGIPGRYVVLLPFDNIIGISRKITSYNERRRLRHLSRTILPKGAGCIIRTAAQGMSEKELIKDWETLIEIWNGIEKKIESSQAPLLLYQDMALASSVIRDLFTPEVKNVIIDSKRLYKEIVNYLKANSPHLVEKVSLYNKPEPIFSTFNVEKELEGSYKRKLQLPSGGSIVVDHTEAMVIVDVNSGKSISENQQEKNAHKTNLEAAVEIARQIRLRDIGGMILVDFIDISDDRFKKKLYMEMRRALSRDRAKTVVYPLTQLSIMQITRQRVNQNISEKMSETCPMCHGSGRIASKSVLLNSIERWLKNFRTNSREFRLVLEVHPNMISFLNEGTISRIARLMIKYFVKIKLMQNEHLHVDQFKFVSVKRQKDVTQEFI